MVVLVFSMASRETNNSMDAAFLALNVSSVPSSITITSVVATSLHNLSVPVSAPLASSSSMANPASSAVLAPEIVALVSQMVQDPLQASQFHPSPAIASSVVPFSAPSSSPDTLNSSATSFLASGTGFQLAQSSSTTQGRNIPIVVPSFVSTFNAPALVLARLQLTPQAVFLFLAPHAKSSTLVYQPSVVGPVF